IKLAGCHFNAEDNRADIAYVKGRSAKVKLTGSATTLNIQLPFGARGKQLSCADLNRDGVNELLFLGSETSPKGRVRQFISAIDIHGVVVRKLRTRKNRKLVPLHGFNGDHEQGFIATFTEGKR